MRERTYDHRCLHTRIYAFVLKYLSSEAKLGGAPDRVRANGGVKRMYAMWVSTRGLSGRLGVRDYISGWWREACARLAFALFLEITLFVVLLSLYIFTGGRFTFSTPVSCLSACLVVRVYRSMCAFHPYLVYLSLSLFLSFSYASPPRLRYPTFPPAVHASPETVVRRGFRRSRGIKRFTRPVAPGDISSRRFPMTSLPWEARISTITFSS